MMANGHAINAKYQSNFLSKHDGSTSDYTFTHISYGLEPVSYTHLTLPTIYSV